MTRLLDWLAGDLPEPVRTSWLLLLGILILTVVVCACLLAVWLHADRQRRLAGPVPLFEVPA